MSGEEKSWRRLYGLAAALRSGEVDVDGAIEEARVVLCSSESESICGRDAIDAIDEFFSALGETGRGAGLASVYRRSCSDYGFELSEKSKKRDVAAVVWAALGFTAMIAAPSATVIGAWLVLGVLLLGVAEHIVSGLCRRWRNCVCGLLEGYRSGAGGTEPQGPTIVFDRLP